jgi:MFS family permease
VGAVLAGLTMILQSPGLYLVSMLTLGMGIAASHQIRVAAADMFPPSRRAEAIGYVLTGALIGTLAGPLLVFAAQSAAPSLGADPIGLSWWFAPVLGLPGLWLIWLVRPDPKEIGSHLERYYPGLRFGARSVPAPGARVGMVASLGTYPRRVAAVASFAAGANMSIVMVIMGVGLIHHGHQLAAISVSQALHTMGMFGFSLPAGYLADVLGRRKLLLVGATIEAAGAFLVGVTPDYWTITLGGFLVGVGWCCVNVSATALVVDTTSAGERGRGVGTIDTFSAAGVVLLSLLAGPVVQGWGVGAAGLLAAALTVPAILQALPLRELSPGRYESPSPGARGASGW